MAGPLAFRAGVIAYGIAGSALCTWVSCKITSSVYSLLYPSNSVTEISQTTSSVTNSPSIRRSRSNTDSRSRRRSKSKSHTPMVVLISTVISTWSFTLTIISAVTLTVTIYTFLGWKSKINANQDEAREQPQCHSQAALNLIFNYCGYGCMLIVIQERLRGILERTRFRLSDNTLRICRCAVGFALFLMVSALSAWAAQQRVLAGLIALPISVIYPSLSFWVSFKYMWTTRLIANEVESSEWANRLLHASLRLTIVSTTAVTSTMLSYLAFLTYLLMGEPEYMRHVFQMIYASDPIVNCYTLMCTFASSDREYMFVFGRFHSYLMMKLRPRTDCETAIVQ